MMVERGGQKSNRLSIIAVIRSKPEWKNEKALKQAKT